MINYEEHAQALQDWLAKAAKSNAELSTARTWCILNIDKSLLEAKLKEYFDRQELGTKYAEEYAKNADSGKPFAYMQTDSDLIYGLHKCFAARHRGRLSVYRDDCAQKNYHVYSAISLGLARYEVDKEEAERAV